MFNIDIQYTWLLLFLPLVVAAFNWFLLTRRPNVAALTSTFSCLATFVLSLGLLDQTGSDSFSWLPISDVFSVDLGFVLDPLSTRMMLVVTGIGLRWLTLYSRSRGEKTMSARLAAEIIDATNNVGGAVKKREDTHKMAEANKAFAHYRY